MCQMINMHKQKADSIRTHLKKKISPKRSYFDIIILTKQVYFLVVNMRAYFYSCYAVKDFKLSRKGRWGWAVLHATIQVASLAASWLKHTLQSQIVVCVLLWHAKQILPSSSSSIS